MPIEITIQMDDAGGIGVKVQPAQAAGNLVLICGLLEVAKDAMMGKVKEQAGKLVQPAPAGVILPPMPGTK